MIRRHRLRTSATCAAVLFAAVCSVSAVSAQESTPPAPAPEQTQAQQQTNPPAQPQSNPPAQPAQTSAEQKEKAQEQKTGTSNDRLFFTLPNFLTVENANQIPPLSAKQKFKVVARSSFDYIEFPWYGFLAGISQAENSEPGYGQGAEGYGKRYGAAFADGTIENFWTSAILPSVLHEDPRFYELGEGSFGHRTWYAMSRIVVTRTDSGHSQFNFSEIFGSAIAAGISTYTYHPHADQTLGNTASVWGSQIGYDTITIVVKEFWPDIRRKIRGHKDPSAAPTPTSP
jgi:hypothetical protein